MPASHHCIRTHTHNRFTALWNLSGTTRVSRYQKKHSPTTLIVVINHPYLLSPSTMIHGIFAIQSIRSEVIHILLMYQKYIIIEQTYLIIHELYTAAYTYTLRCLWYLWAHNSFHNLLLNTYGCWVLRCRSHILELSSGFHLGFDHQCRLFQTFT